MTNRTKLAVAAVGLLVLSVPLLLAGAAVFAFAGPTAGPTELGGDPVLHQHHVTIGGLTLTGPALWAVPLVAGSGGTFGGMALLICARRAGRRDR